MKAETIMGVSEVASCERDWLEHCLSSVKKYLKNAVVIDNDPDLGVVKFEQVQAPLVEEGSSPATLFDDGMLGEIPALKAPEFLSGAHQDILDDHSINIRAVSDAFVDVGISCAFVLPADSEKKDESKVKRALSAAELSDIVVIDWYLKPKSPSLTIEILKQLARADNKESGRMRLICVYTGQTLTSEIFGEMKDALSAGGVSLVDVEGRVYQAKNSSCLLIALNKGETAPSKLPAVLLEAFTVLADGLIPSFALAAVGAIRNNIHHMVSRFDKGLDVAYVANRLITDPPGDVAELMRELLVSECDNALGLDSIADKFLDVDPVLKWLKFKEKDFSSKQYIPAEGAKEQSIDRNYLERICEHGLVGSSILGGEGIPSITLPEKKRHLISEALAGAKENSRKSENSFARLVAFRREAYDSKSLTHGVDWLPSLTTGTLLKANRGSVSRYFLCLTPACDALRLTKDKAFVFLEGYVKDKPYNIIIVDSDGEEKGLHFDKKSPVISTFKFKPDQKVRRVRAVKIKRSGIHYRFKTSDPKPWTFTWLGEVRYGRAVNEMAQLNANWMRIGIVDSEHLRLAERSMFKFK